MRTNFLVLTIIIVVLVLAASFFLLLESGFKISFENNSPLSVSSVEDCARILKDPGVFCPSFDGPTTPSLTQFPTLPSRDYGKSWCGWSDLNSEGTVPFYEFLVSFEVFPDANIAAAELSARKEVLYRTSYNLLSIEDSPDGFFITVPKSIAGHPDKSMKTYYALRDNGLAIVSQTFLSSNGQYCSDAGVKDLINSL